MPVLTYFNIKYFKDYEKSWGSSDFALEHNFHLMESFSENSRWVGQKSANITVEILPDEDPRTG